MKQFNLDSSNRFLPAWVWETKSKTKYNITSCINNKF